MIRRLAWLLVLSALSSMAHAAPQGAVPAAARFPVLDVNRVDAVLAAPLDLELLGKQDAADDYKGVPPRFAVPERVSITPANHGTWEDLGNGEMLWRLRILGREGSTSLNLGFTRFRMSPNSRLLIYSADGSEQVRPFTAADNVGRTELWTPVVVTRDLVVELTVPKKERRDVALKLGWINQGYRGFGTTPGPSYTKSGSCEMDIECLGSTDPLRKQARSVGVMSSGGSRFCTGSLVNDTANDRKLYFMTANHCQVTAGNASSLVVYWNYKNSFCRTPGSAQSGSAGNGTLTQFNTGSTFRAAYAPSDFTLVELLGSANAAHSLYWSGWDRSTGNFACSGTTPCVAIHHPNTDEKRITYSLTTTANTSYLGTTSPGDNTHLWVHWATDPPGTFTVPGVTEPGSSGSPLYSPAGRYIGQLHGGLSTCGATGNNLSDYYGRFNVSWAGGGTNSTRLSNWLDAGSTGSTAIDGRCALVNASVSGPSSEPLHVSSTYTASVTGTVSSIQYWWSQRFHSTTTGWSGWSTPFQGSASTTASINSCGLDQFELRVEIRSGDADCPGVLGTGSEVVTITGAC